MRSKTLVIVLAILLCVSGTGHLIGLSHVRIANKTLDSERLRNESLLSEKLSIEKSADKLKQEVQLIIDANASSEAELGQLREMIHVKKAQLKRFALEQNNMSRTNMRLQKQIDSLERKMIAIESEAMHEKRKLQDSIRYLVEFNETLSAERDGKMNQ